MTIPPPWKRTKRVTELTSPTPTWDSLLDLLTVIGPAGDEGAIADVIVSRASHLPGVQLVRIGDDVIAVRGTPRTAIFAHLDTVGYTLSYRNALIPLGGPSPRNGDKLRCVDGLLGRVSLKDRKARLADVTDASGAKAVATPGSRWVYARKPKIADGVIKSPYLDDRAGVWAALQALARCPHIAVAFCTGEEQHGHGARVCADYLARKHAIRQALIADITWHTKDTPNGKGVVVSLRDAFSPAQRFLDRVLTLATESAIPYQREIQSAGSSDGGHILRSAAPIDWVFIGAPSKDPHTSRERITLTDLEGMADLLAYLVDKL